MAAVARSPSSTPSYSLPHPPQRRPSVMRRTSSSSSFTLLSPVPRFSPEATTIPAPIYNKPGDTQRPPAVGQKCSFSGPVAGTSPPERPTIKTSTSGGSLLQRRRSSAAKEKPNFSLSPLVLDDLPNPLAKLPVELDRLDDTVPKEVIGMSSAAVTPDTPSDGTVLVEESYKPTKSRKVGTPFPEKRSFIEDEDEEEEDSDTEGDAEGRQEVP